MAGIKYFNVELLNDHVCHVINSPWPGRNGSSKRCVYFTMCFFSFLHRGTIIHASSRDLSIRTGLSLRTISKALISLIENNLIIRIRRENTHTNPSVLADSFEMIELINIMNSVDEESECLLTEQMDEFEFYDYLLWQMHDVFRWKGLGKSSLEVYFDLTQHPASKVSDIAIRTGRARTTVYKCIKYMTEGIVNRITNEPTSMIIEENHKYSAVYQNLGEIAEILGVAGMSKQMQDRYQIEREVHRRWVLRVDQRDGRETIIGHVRSLDTLD